MSDFSEYGIPSQEWLQLFSQYDMSDLPEHLPPKIKQETLNFGRNQASEKWIASRGSRRPAVSFWDFQIPTRDNSSIIARLYRRRACTGKKPLYIFFHPGGFFSGTISSEDAVCTRIVDALDILVLHVCYRHSPDFQWPTQVHDAFDTFDWVVGPGSYALSFRGADIEKLVVGGMSAGAMLAADVALREVDRIKEYGMRISGLVLHIPWLLHPNSWEFQPLKSKVVSSYEQCKDAPTLPRTQVDFFVEQVAAHNDKWFNVGLMGDEKAKLMPKTAIIVAGWDILRDDGLLFARKLQRNNVPVQVHIFPGLPHGFRRAEHVEASRGWDQQVWQDIRWCLSEDHGFLQLRIPDVGV